MYSPLFITTYMIKVILFQKIYRSFVKIIGIHYGGGKGQQILIAFL